MKSLHEIEKLFKETVHKLPTSERFEYCDNYINQATHVLATSGHHLGSEQKERLKNLIDTAKQEIQLIKEE